MLEKKARVHFIFATILLDALGIGLLVPILPDLIRHFSKDPAFVSQYYGYFISVYALMQFLASPVLGSISDRFGRRPILLVSLLGAGLDYLIMAFAPNLGLLFVGRIISGLTGASMTVATAYMADISDDSNRSANFGMIGAGWGVGFVVGPALGGVLGSFSWRWPFIAAAVLNLINFAFGYFILPESLPASLRRNIELKRLNPFSSLAKVFKPSPLLALIWVYILIFLAGQVHPSTWTLYTQLKFNWTAFEVGLSISCIGISIAIVQGGLTRIVIPKMGEWNALAFSIVVSVLTYLAFAFATRGWMMYAILVISAIAGIGGPAIQSMITKQIPPQEQGEFQGTLVSLGSLTAVVGPLFFTGLFTEFTKHQAPVYFPGASYAGATVICLLSGLLLFFNKRPRTGV
jgi:DHA1 family tetracycline resistance protein-like MFS transporter